MSIDYCYGCEMVGHLVRDCRKEGVADLKELGEFPYDSWLRANMQVSRSSRSDVALLDQGHISAKGRGRIAFLSTSGDGGWPRPRSVRGGLIFGQVQSSTEKAVSVVELGDAMTPAVEKIDIQGAVAVTVPLSMIYGKISSSCLEPMTSTQATKKVGILVSILESSDVLPTCIEDFNLAKGTKSGM